MSANKHLEHLLVLPEDDANRQLANGFQQDAELLAKRYQVLGVAGGWSAALDQLENDHVRDLNKYPKRHLVLLIDLDSRLERLEQAKARIPADLEDRVFVLGVLSEPEALKRASLGTYETIGRALAEECRKGTNAIWSHELLRHNAGELERLRTRVRPFLFAPV